MQRRTVIKNFIYAAGGALLLPACLHEQAGASIPLKNIHMTADDEKLLGEVVGTIIPATDTPGAKDLGVHQFAMIMIDDCYDKETQDQFVKGLQGLNAAAKKQYGQSFIELPVVQREELLLQLEKAGDKADKNDATAAFYKHAKRLTIQGYLNSKYVMTHITKYELVPGRFHGSVPVTKSVSA